MHDSMVTEMSSPVELVCCAPSGGCVGEVIKLWAPLLSYWWCVSCASLLRFPTSDSAARPRIERWRRTRALASSQCARVHQRDETVDLSTCVTRRWCSYGVRVRSPNEEFQQRRASGTAGTGLEGPRGACRSMLAQSTAVGERGRSNTMVLVCAERALAPSRDGEGGEREKARRREAEATEGRGAPTEARAQRERSARVR